jgi:[ribosomal protein S18]-alanine N-acetyltransferase
VTAPLQRVDPSELVVELAPMRRRHLRSVLRIEAHNPHRPWSLGLFMSELALRSSRVYAVARSGSAVVGFAGLMLTGDDGHVTTIAVDPAWRRATIGTRLMLLLARQAVRLGAHNLTLEVRANNVEAQGLYRRFGLLPAGLRKNYYSDLKEDAIVMWAHGIDTPEYAARLSRIEEHLPGDTVLVGW